MLICKNFLKPWEIQNFFSLWELLGPCVACNYACKQCTFTGKYIFKHVFECFISLVTQTDTLVLLDVILHTMLCKSIHFPRSYLTILSLIESWKVFFCYVGTYLKKKFIKIWWWILINKLHINVCDALHVKIAWIIEQFHVIYCSEKQQGSLWSHGSAFGNTVVLIFEFVI